MSGILQSLTSTIENHHLNTGTPQFLRANPRRLCVNSVSSCGKGLAEHHWPGQHCTHVTYLHINCQAVLLMLAPQCYVLAARRLELKISCVPLIDNVAKRGYDEHLVLPLQHLATVRVLS